MNITQKGAARDALQDEFDKAVEKLAKQLVNGGRVYDWQRAFAKELKRNLLTQVTLAKGKPLTEDELNKLNKILAREYDYQIAFADSLALRLYQDEELSLKGIVHRSLMYGGSARAQFYRFAEDSLEAGWVVDYVANIGACDACVNAQSNSPYLPSQGKFPGDVCYGKGRCRCDRVPRFSPTEYQTLSGDILPAKLARVPRTAVEPVIKPATRKATSKVDAKDYRTFEDIDKVDKWGRAYYHPSKLSEKEIEKIQFYEDEGYRRINKSLREGIPPTGKTDEAIKTIEAVIEKFPLPENLTVYRAVKPKFGSEFTIGTVFQDKGFISTAITPDIATGFYDSSTILEILVPKGHKSFFMSREIARNDESELLLQRGTRFQVVAINARRRIAGDFFKVITLKVVK